MLRHVIAHFRRQDWMAVTIELVIVILGVFIGMQVSNWNEDRETNQKAAVFTQRLKADLREEAWGYEMQIGYFDEVLDSAKQATDALTGKNSLSSEALLIAAYRATQFNGNTRRRATYDELISTGEIGLIHDEALRDLAMRVYTDPVIDQITQDGQHSEYRKEFRMAIPYDVQLVLADKCGDRVVPVGNYSAIAQVLDYPCATGLSPAAIEAADATLKKNPRIVPLLQLRIADIGTDLGNLEVYYASTIRKPLRRLAQEKP
ncbi:MAG: hypothetical protein KGI64_04130 [Xanthomonadaceae bacterium]|nr:hypothetical protein [Xanthomonadaceae bacterium]MDE2084032.1 hypothetical protein [Xanthomonadaceae bacterium]MDE2256976.1 hypothetical protein [Xanthomonadaceae bacterium]